MSKLTQEEQEMVFELLHYAKVENWTADQMVSLQVNVINTLLASREVV
jgi:hypothetical protein